MAFKHVRCGRILDCASHASDCADSPTYAACTGLQRDNISSYLRFCRKVGLPQSDLFEPDDLYEAKNLAGVLDNIFALGGYAQALDGFEVRSWLLAERVVCVL